MASEIHESSQMNHMTGYLDGVETAINRRTSEALTAKATQDCLLVGALVVWLSVTSQPVNFDPALFSFFNLVALQSG